LISPKAMSGQVIPLESEIIIIDVYMSANIGNSHLGNCRQALVPSKKPSSYRKQS